jgi:hypothetical protein
MIRDVAELMRASPVAGFPSQCSARPPFVHSGQRSTEIARWGRAKNKSGAGVGTHDAKTKGCRKTAKKKQLQEMRCDMKRQGATPKEWKRVRDMRCDSVEDFRVKGRVTCGLSCSSCRGCDFVVTPNDRDVTAAWGMAVPSSARLRLQVFRGLARGDLFVEWLPPRSC